MALTKSMELRNLGIELPEAYIRISDYIDSRRLNSPHVSIQLDVFVSETARNENKDPAMQMGVYTCSQQNNPVEYEKFFSLESQEKEGNNPIKMAYKWLKTLPAFDNSEDHLVNSDPIVVVEEDPPVVEEVADPIIVVEEVPDPILVEEVVDPILVEEVVDPVVEEVIDPVVVEEDPPIVEEVIDPVVEEVVDPILTDPDPTLVDEG